VELVEASEGTGAREAWRRFLHGTLTPLGRLIAGELERVVNAPVEISFNRLMASDISGRARAFQSLVGGGMDPAQAAGLSGLLED